MPVGAVIPASRNSDISPPSHTRSVVFRLLILIQTPAHKQSSQAVVGSRPLVWKSPAFVYSTTQLDTRPANNAGYWIWLNGSEHEELQWRWVCLLIDLKIKTQANETCTTKKTRYSCMLCLVCYKMKWCVTMLIQTSPLLVNCFLPDSF